MLRRQTIFFLFIGLVSSVLSAQDRERDPQHPIALLDDGSAVQVEIDDQLFTHYDYSSFKKPVFYPLLGPLQLPLTRHFPMKQVEGEANDHPHHKSVWWGHEINGIDFWSEKGGIVKLQEIALEQSAGGFTARHDWIDNRTGDVVVGDRIQFRFSGNRNRRIIDCAIQFVAASSNVVFADTKEGFFAVRVHPSLRAAADPERGVERVSGAMINSNGEQGKTIWGKRADWVCYHGTVDGNRCGVAIFDHPENLRHPTTWHARDYGLLAANPFGLSYFQGAEKGAGRFVLPPGKTLSLKYRLLFFAGEEQLKTLGTVYQEFCQR